MIYALVALGAGFIGFVLGAIGAFEAIRHFPGDNE